MTAKDLTETVLEGAGLMAITGGVWLVAGVGLALIVCGVLVVLAVELNDMGRRG